MERKMNRRNFGQVAITLAATAFAAFAPQAAASLENGIVKAKSAYSMPETIERITKDIAKKGIKLFDVIDQAKLAKDAGVDLKPSTLIIFGNPPLGTLFLTSNAESGLDWPVRLLVFQDDKGQVWTAYTDFSWIAKRHGIKNRQPQFKMASEVIASITSVVKAR
jgi:uncharacterized protein (DUF302 family)